MFSIKHNFQTEKDSININELAEIKSQETGQRALHLPGPCKSNSLFSAGIQAPGTNKLHLKELKIVADVITS